MGLLQVFRRSEEWLILKLLGQHQGLGLLYSLRLERTQSRHLLIGRYILYELEVEFLRLHWKALLCFLHLERLQFRSHLEISIYHCVN